MKRASGQRFSRPLAQKLSEVFGQPVIVDNRAGAGGAIGADFVAKAAPDGYTLGMGNAGTHASSPHLMKSVPYDPVTQFAPIGRIGSFVFMLAVPSSVRMPTMRRSRRPRGTGARSS